MTIEEYTKDTFEFITSEFDDKDLDYFITNIKEMVENYLENYEEIQKERDYDNYVDSKIDELRLMESESK